MKTLQLIGHIDDRHQLRAEVPSDVPPGSVTVVVVVPSETDQNEESAQNEQSAQIEAWAWLAGIAREWAAELSDPSEDIYTLSDGAPVDGAG